MKFEPLILTDFFPSPQYPHEGLCVQEQMAHLPGSKDAVLLCPAISYLPLPRYKFCRSHQIKKGWQGAEKNIYRIPAYYFPLIGEKIIMRRLLKEAIHFIHWNRTTFNLIHANWAYRSGAVAAALASYAGVPFVLTIWGSDIDIWLHERRKARAIFEALKAANAVIVQNRTHASKLLALGVEANRVFRLPLGIDTAKFTVPVRKNRSSHYTLAMIGNLFKDKGHREVLQALAHCSSEIRLNIIGDGDEYATLIKLVAETGIAGRVKFAGMKSPTQIPAILQKSDGLVIGSYHEGAPKVLLEALSCGLPVISTKVGLAPEIIKQNNGYLVETGDIPGLTLAMNRLAKRLWDAEAIRACALPFDWKNFEQRIKTIYQFALEN